ESLENAMFSADPEVDISIICYDPDLYSTSSTEVDIETVDGTVETPIEYDGTTETGFIFTMTLDQDLPDGIALYNTPPSTAYQVMVIEAGMRTANVTPINTIPGQKSIPRTRGAVTPSLLYALQVGYMWLQFYKGTNSFRAYGDADDPISGTIPYTSKFGGI